MHHTNSKFLRELAALMLLTFCSYSYAGPSINFGFGLGQGEIDIGASNFNDGSLVGTLSEDQNTFSWTAYGEMNFNRFLRMEFGIIDTGMASMKGNSNGMGSYWWSGPVSADYGLLGIKLGGVGVIPFGMNDNFKLYAKAGYINWLSFVTLHDSLSEQTETDTGLSPYFGFGTELDLTKLISLRLQHERFKASSSSDYFVSGYDLRYSSTSLGLLFRF